MIQRISQAYKQDELRTAFSFCGESIAPIKQYNIAGLSSAQIIVNDPEKSLVTSTWGLVSCNSKSGINNGNLINVRITMLPTAPSFRIPIRSQRCLIPVDSFYVWQNRGISQIPHRVFSENQPVLLLAGLWDVWKDPFKTIHTFSIIITKAHNRLRDITNWVPVVFNTRDAAEMWLEPQGLSEIITLVRGQHIPALQSYRVSETINSLNVNSIDVQKQDIIVPTLFD